MKKSDLLAGLILTHYTKPPTDSNRLSDTILTRVK